MEGTLERRRVRQRTEEDGGAGGSAASGAPTYPPVQLDFEPLSSLFDDASLSDVTLIVEPMPGSGGARRHFCCHKVLLASLSTYFRALFTGGMQEASQSEVVLQGQDPDLCESVLRLLYGQPIEVTPENVLTFLHLADFYGIPQVACTPRQTPEPRTPPPARRDPSRSSSRHTPSPRPPRPPCTSSPSLFPPSSSLHSFCIPPPRVPTPHSLLPRLAPPSLLPPSSLPPPRLPPLLLPSSTAPPAHGGSSGGLRQRRRLQLLRQAQRGHHAQMRHCAEALPSHPSLGLRRGRPAARFLPARTRRSHRAPCLRCPHGREGGGGARRGGHVVGGAAQQRSMLRLDSLTGRLRRLRSCIR